MPRWIAGLIFLFMNVPGMAGAPPLVLTEATRSISTAKNAEVVEDRSGSLKIVDLLAMADEKFLPQSALKTLNTSSVYWVRVKLNSALPTDTVFIVSAFWWDYIDAYVVRADASFEALRQSGLRGKPSSAKESFYATFALHRGEDVVVYTRLQSTGQFRVPSNATVTLRPQLAQLAGSEYGLYLDGIIFGILFGLTFYTLMLAVSTRDKSYYWYCAYLLLISISFMGQMGNQASKITQFIIPELPTLAIWIKRVADPLGWVCLAMFTRSFLSTRLMMPRWDKLMMALIGLQIIDAVWSFMVGFTANFGWVTYAAIVIACMTTGAIRWSKGFVYARYFVAAQSILLIASLPGLASLIGWNLLDFLPQEGFSGYVRSRIVFIGFALEAMLFSLALAQRMRALQDEAANRALAFEIERKRIVEEQKQNLEVQVVARTLELSVEQEKSNRLLYNILPTIAADELMATGVSQPRRFDEATILFTDFKGFTSMVSTLPPKKVVEELNDIFHHFDDIITACGIEKIKTIGDAYMIAGGLPTAQPDHAERCVDAAVKMMAYIDERNQTSSLKWLMRAGLHSGAVVAGVVGKNKFTYDVWGDTVNIASRMESASEPGRINLSAYTHDLVKHRFPGQYRGKIDAKGKGEIDMYFVV